MTENQEQSGSRTGRFSVRSLLQNIFICLFCASVLLALTGRWLCIRNTRDYQSLQPEFIAPDEIASVMGDDALGQIYVCYNDASYVNVYDRDGNFRWAVSTPYLRNTCFDLTDDGQLLIYNGMTVYIYRSDNGAFIGESSTDGLGLSYDREENYPDIYEPGSIYYRTYNVYKAAPDGTLVAIVDRPLWFLFFNFGLCLILSFTAAAGYGILLFLTKSEEYRAARAAFAGAARQPFTGNRRARVILRYFKITVTVQLLYAALNILSGIWFSGILCIAIIPVTLHFMISSVILWNLAERIKTEDRERSVMDFWQMSALASFLIAFFSVVVVVLLQ